MPKKKPVARVKEADLTHVLVVGEDGKLRANVIEHVKKRGLSLWPAKGPETAMSSFKHGLRVAMVIITMASIEEGCTFAAWMGVNHPDVKIVFTSTEDSNHQEFSSRARAAGAKYVVPHTQLSRELPRILAYHLDEPTR